VGLAAAAGACLYVLLVLPQSNDDAFITFRTAENLAAGAGPYFNPGEAVQGATTPLYVLLLAAGRRLTGIRVDRFEVFLEAPAVLAIAWLLFCLGRSSPAICRLACLLPLILFLHPFEISYSKGMETFLYCALILSVIVAEARGKWIWAGLGMGLVAATRTEGGLLGLSYLLYWAAGRAAYGSRAFPLKRLGAVAGLAILAGLPFLVYVLTWYDSLLPASVVGKMAQGQRGWPTFGPEALRYLFARWGPFPPVWGPLLLLGGLAFLLRRGPRRRAPKAWRIGLATYRGLGLLAVHALLYGAAFTILKAPNYNWYLLPLQVLLVPFYGLSCVALWRFASGWETAAREGAGPGAPSEETGGEAPSEKAGGEREAEGESGRAGTAQEQGMKQPAVRAAVLVFFSYAAFLRVFALAFILYLSRGIDPGFPPQTGYPEAGKYLARHAGKSGWTFAGPEIGYLGYHSGLRCLDLAGLVSPECRPFFGRQPLARTVLHFRPELYVTAYCPELTPGLPEYDPNLAEEFLAHYRMVHQIASMKGYVRIYCRRDLPWPPSGQEGPGDALHEKPD
jgi:hypothetical protein